MSVLITGATGFLGSELARSLVASAVDVHIVHRPSSSLELISDFIEECTCHKFDGEPDSLTSIMSQVNPDAVYHLAALYVPAHRPCDIAPLISSNITFATQLLDAMTKTGCRNLVMTGTTWQHFSDSESAPATLYAATKSAQEVIAEYFASAFGLSVGAVLLSDTYGPRDPRRKLFWLLRQAAATGAPIEMSEGRQILDLVYVDDVVSAIRKAGVAVKAGTDGFFSRWTVKPIQRYSLRQVVSVWERATGKHVPVTWGRRPYRQREVMRPWQDGDVVPNWAPVTALEDGIRLMESTHDKY